VSNVLVKNLRSARDLRAAIVDLAIGLEDQADVGDLKISNSQLSKAKIQTEWRRALQVLDKRVRNRLRYQIVEGEERVTDIGSRKLALDKPNYRYEVVRQLLHAQLEHGSVTLPMGSLINAIGVSETPIRRAVYQLRRFGLLAPRERLVQLAVLASELSWEVLVAAEATPQVLKFRFERGTQIRAPSYMLERAHYLLSYRGNDEWKNLSLSGVPVAQRDVPSLDITGTPRLDLQLLAGNHVSAFNMSDMHKLINGLELDENRLEPAPVAITVTRSRAQLERKNRARVRQAAKCDVLISLLALGLRSQAVQYAQQLAAS